MRIWMAKKESNRTRNDKAERGCKLMATKAVMVLLTMKNEFADVFVMHHRSISFGYLLDIWVRSGLRAPENKENSSAIKILAERR